MRRATGRPPDANAETSTGVRGWPPARLGRRPRAGPERARARIPRREPRRGGGRGRTPAATNRRLRALLAGLAALLALAVVAGVVALNQRGEARDTARTADAQRLGLEALGQERLDQALLTASAAVELDDSPATQSNLLSVLQRNPATLGPCTTTSASSAQPSARTAG